MVQHRWIIVVLAVSLLLLPSAGIAQRRGDIPRVGVLEPGPPYHPESPSICHVGFQQGLRDLGYVAGQNITFEYRYAEHQVNRLPVLATDVVRLAPDVIWTYSDQAARAAKQATTTIPIVVGVATNLVDMGLVASLAHPSGNLTGMDFRNVDLMGKRLELLKEAIPTISRVAVLVDPAVPTHAHVPGNIETEAHALGVRLQRVDASDPGAFEAAFAVMVDVYRGGARRWAQASGSTTRGVVARPVSGLGVHRRASPEGTPPAASGAPLSRTNRCRRGPPASALLPLPGAPERRR